MRKRTATILLASSAGLLLSCCLFPNVVFRAFHGSYPLTPEQYRDFEQLVTPGMTRTEVRAVVGEPHETYLDRDGTSTWIYYPSHVSSAAGVYFDKAGVVTRSVTQI
jgi:outer membrane protein assembly factor BamE (lipoprotein component of BamABCDE complex)